MIFDRLFGIPLPKWIQREYDRTSQKFGNDYWSGDISHWPPRHFEIARLAHIFRIVSARVDAREGIPANAPREVKVLEPGCGNGFIACLLALENISVKGFDLKSDALKYSSSFKRFFRKAKRELGLTSTLSFGKRDIRNIEDHKDDYKLLMHVWPNPVRDTNGRWRDCREYWARLDPEAIVAVSEMGCTGSESVPICMAERPFDYNYTIGWWSQGSLNLRSRLTGLPTLNSYLTTVEVYTKEKFSKRQLQVGKLRALNKVKPYPWEVMIDEASEGIDTSDLYCLRKE